MKKNSSEGLLLSQNPKITREVCCTSLALLDTCESVGAGISVSSFIKTTLELKGLNLPSAQLKAHSWQGLLEEAIRSVGPALHVTTPTDGPHLTTSRINHKLKYEVLIKLLLTHFQTSSWSHNLYVHKYASEYVVINYLDLLNNTVDY